MLFGLMETGFPLFYWGNALMIVIALILIYLAIAKDMEPLLLVPIGFGMILVNLPLGGMMDYEMRLKAPQAGTVMEISTQEGKGFDKGSVICKLDSGEVVAPVFGRVGELIVEKGQHVEKGQVVASIFTMEQTDQAVYPSRPVGLLSRIFQYGVMWQILPPLMFLCLGALTDFGPMLANPKTLLLGAAAQFGVYLAFFMALFVGFTLPEAASIGIIGGAEGPTTIYVSSVLAPHIIGATAVACYSYMALVPIIIPPVIRLLTTKKERGIFMKPSLRKVSKVEKIVFPLITAIIVILIVPTSAALMGCFMVGNLFKECGVTERLRKTAQTTFVDLITIFLTLAIGASMPAQNFLQPKTLLILVLGVISFASAAGAGVLLAKFMNLFLKVKINPMIGGAGVSAVPMSARVVQVMGQKENPKNILLMHAMGPNVAGAIGAAIAGGVFIGILG
ncbi:MAG TPA: sodium ion-translocating decarboxylase subunit beta [Syntrophales bacterium]|nr:sodium ion-translocating decarboxylase subunit beta [Syntrophales bacterium]HOH72337.1 sodium ion-translocating decarboxylase subunit beta [Syntrophales bacterium]HPN08350.1 sodium ion-translocating decarboxylase subunit beta [Syntrophales bacterium]HPX80351.1 sodium ion-translocating decarboxylase subunit beta [Syntrophales bacterium]